MTNTIKKDKMYQCECDICKPEVPLPILWDIVSIRADIKEMLLILDRIDKRLERMIIDCRK